MPMCINISFDTCKVRRGFLDASDACEQLSYTLLDALLIVGDHFLSAVSCHFPGPAALFRPHAQQPYGTLPHEDVLCMYAILRQRPYVIP